MALRHPRGLSVIAAALAHGKVESIEIESGESGIEDVLIERGVVLKESEQRLTTQRGRCCVPFSSCSTRVARREPPCSSPLTTKHRTRIAAPQS